MTRGERVAAAARALIGVPFRLHGRDPTIGLDCVGVVAAALRGAGHIGPMPEGYAIRCGNAQGYADCWQGLAPAGGGQAGDILLCRVAAMHLHLAVRTQEGIIHADVGLGRVVARPGAPPWPIETAWQLGEG